MKIIIDTQTLKTTLSIIMLAVPGHNIDPALENISIQVNNKSLTITAFNNELCIIKNIDIVEGEDGNFLIPAKLFFEIVKKTECKNIILEIDEKMMINITAGQSKYSLVGMEFDRYPHIPRLNPNNIENISINQRNFAQMSSQVMFAVSSSEDKPVYKGILFEQENNSLTVVAVDGFRLAMCKRETKSDKNIKFIVPASTITELLRIIKPSSDENYEIELKISDKYMLIELEDATVISRLIVGDFLNYHEAIKGKTIKTLTVNRQLLLSSIERTSLLISDRIKNPLKLEFESESIKLSSITPMGKASDTCPCRSDGESIVMGFNNRFLIDALKNTDSDEIKIEICGQIAPLKIMPLEGDDFLFIVVPMRIS